MNKLFVYTYFTIIFCLGFLQAETPPNLSAAARASALYKQMIGTTLYGKTAECCDHINKAANLLATYEQFKTKWRVGTLMGITTGITTSRNTQLGKLTVVEKVAIGSCIGILNEIFLQILHHRTLNKVNGLLLTVNDAKNADPVAFNLPIVMDALLKAVTCLENEKSKKPFYDLIQEIDGIIRGRLSRFGWEE